MRPRALVLALVLALGALGAAERIVDTLDTMENVLDSSGGLSILAEKQPAAWARGDGRRLRALNHDEHRAVWHAPGLESFRVTAYTCTAKALRFFLISLENPNLPPVPIKADAHAGPLGVDTWRQVIYSAAHISADDAMDGFMIVFPATPKSAPVGAQQLGQLELNVRASLRTLCQDSARFRSAAAGPLLDREAPLAVALIPKPFTVSDDVAFTQSLALHSLARMPYANVLMFGSEEGFEEAAAREGAHVVTDVLHTSNGVPSLGSALALTAAAYPEAGAIVYANADIIFPMRDCIQRVVAEARANFDRFLIIGLRRDTDLSALREEWEAKSAAAHAAAAAAGFDLAAPGRSGMTAAELDAALTDIFGLTFKTAAGNWIDYFIFSNDGLVDLVGPIEVGRSYIDWYLMHLAFVNGAAIIDATEAVAAYHGDHQYNHLKQGTRRAPELVEHNGRIMASALGLKWDAEGVSYLERSMRLRKRLPLFTILRSTYVVSPDGDIVPRTYPVSAAGRMISYCMGKLTKGGILETDYVGPTDTLVAAAAVANPMQRYTVQRPGTAAVLAQLWAQVGIFAAGVVLVWVVRQRRRAVKR